MTRKLSQSVTGVASRALREGTVIERERGTHPLPVVVVVADTRAPLSSRRRRTPAWPCRDAMCRGVMP